MSLDTIDSKNCFLIYKSLFPNEPEIESVEQRIARYDSFAPVHWRWDLAQRIISGRERNPGEMSPELTAAVEFLRRRAAGKRKQASRDRSIAAALELFEANTPVRWEVEARILARQSNAAISRRTGVSAAVIAIYEPLFFAVRYCQESYDYLLSEVVGWCHQRGFRNNEVRQFWAWSAMAGGRLVVDMFVEYFRESRRRGEIPTMSEYVCPGSSLDLEAQSLIALLVIPRESDAKWLIDFPVRQHVAAQTRNPDAAMRRIKTELVRCAHTVLETGEVPNPPRWWRDWYLESDAPDRAGGERQASYDRTTTNSKEQPRERTATAGNSR